MRTRINGVVSSLNDFPDALCMLGIWGMGGGGKTTLARAVFDQISFQFEGKSFVANVREVSKPDFSGLNKLQQQVLRDVSNDQGIKVNNVFDGKTMMKKKMPGRKVLVVLDDVDHIDQLKALAGEPTWFKPGSKIIITTRDKQVLVAHKVKLIHDVNLLTNDEAICLLSRCAFDTNIPIQGYEKLSSQVVLYAAGLPLTITVLGSFLCGKIEDEWRNVIQRLKTIPSKDTLDILEISYTGLEEEHKEIFLDVACILKGWHKEDAIRTLESCGFYARIGLRVLEQKSLVTISEYGRLGMHDKIEEMGQYIVRRKLGEPNKHSRLWIDEEIKDILVSDQGTNEAVRCIKITSEVNLEIVMKGLGNMKKLRYLHVVYTDVDYLDSNWKFDEVREYFPNALQCLRWESYPFGSLPNSFQANNLVELIMPYSQVVQLWEAGDRKVLHKLRFLDLSDSNLKNVDLVLAPNLEILNLEGCYDLVELHMPTKCLKLEYINIDNSKLRTLDLRGTRNLEQLSSLDCDELLELHMPVECPKLQSIGISSSNLRTLDLRGTQNLEALRVEECIDLVELHIPVECLKLEYIHVNNSKLRTLDLRGTPNIGTLALKGCDDLVELHLHIECLKLTVIDIMGTKLRTIDLGCTPNLKKLSLIECSHLVELQAHDGCLKKLDHIDLSDCLRFKSFSFRRQFESVEVGSVSKLHLIAASKGMCPLHFGTNLPKFQFICLYEEHGPSVIGNLEKLLSFGLCACTNLERFSQSICGLRCLTKLTLEGSIPEAPKDLDQLECLEELHLLCTKITHLPDSICMLKHLKHLELNSCWLLEKLPEDLGRLECLEMLILSDSVFLQDIPDSICKMKRLEYLHIRYCVAVEKLPDELGRLECLEELNIEGTNIRHLPQSIFALKGLRIVGFELLLESYGFTSEIQTSEDETFVEL